MVKKMKDSLNIAIAGATGYVGLELIKILSKHSKVRILYLCAKKSAGKKIYTFDKTIIKKNLPKITKIEKSIPRTFSGIWQFLRLRRARAGRKNGFQAKMGARHRLRRS